MLLRRKNTRLRSSAKRQMERALAGHLVHERLPALEHDRELLARPPVRGDRVHVRPVLGELRLELLDQPLLLLDVGSRAASSFCAARGASPAWRASRAFGRSGCGRGLDPLGPGAGRSRPSRPRRTRCGCPRRRACAARRASRSARSCETSSTVPGNASSAASSASRLSRSRWFVGSSSTRKFAPEATTSASASRRRSPPESAPTWRSCISQPVKRKRAEQVLRLGPVEAGRALRHAEHGEALVQLDLVLGEVGGHDAVARPRRAGGGLAPAEHRLEQRGLPRAVRPDERDVLAALQREGRVGEQGLVARRRRRGPSPRGPCGRCAAASGSRIRASGCAA